MKSLMVNAAKAAGKAILKNYHNIGKLKFKAPRNLVTKSDVLSEKAVIGTIRKKFPEHNFLTEESGVINKGSEYTWIVDPIDGTTNFVAKIPQFAVSIALAKNNEVLMGVVYNPCSNEMFFAEKGKGSYLNNKKLKVSKKNNFEHCILGFNLPNDINIGKKTLSILHKNCGVFRVFRNSGSAALNLCYVADRRFDLYFSLGIKAWDIAAAKLIVEEAGGKTTNINNKKWDINDTTIAGSNKILHDKFIKLLR
ncbi:MAG: inositol monophosphatase family protein [Nanoarchaeota archaeon]